MMTPIFYTAIIATLFVAYLVLSVTEERRGQRFFMRKIRLKLDNMLDDVSLYIGKTIRHVLRYTITLSWYYSLHAFLKFLLQSLAGTYHLVEAILIKNRNRARELRKERRSSRSHLTQIAEHKAEVKLTAAEVRKRKDKALKGR